MEYVNKATIEFNKKLGKWIAVIYYDTDNSWIRQFDFYADACLFILSNEERVNQEPMAEEAIENEQSDVVSPEDIPF